MVVRNQTILDQLQTTEMHAAAERLMYIIDTSYLRTMCYVILATVARVNIVCVSLRHNEHHTVHDTHVTYNITLTTLTI